MIVRLYYAQQLVKQWWRSSHFSSLGGIPFDIRETYGLEVYNGGYISCTPGNGHGTEWYRCDLIPVLDAEVPKELRLLELLNPP